MTRTCRRGVSMPFSSRIPFTSSRTSSASSAGRRKRSVRPDGSCWSIPPRAALVKRPPHGHEHHHDSPDAAEARLRQAGFEIVSRDDAFVDASSHGRWWLIVARKP